jgi:hypothetical protein
MYVRGSVSSCALYAFDCDLVNGVCTTSTCAAGLGTRIGALSIFEAASAASARTSKFDANMLQSDLNENEPESALDENGLLSVLDENELLAENEPSVFKDRLSASRAV